MEALIQAAQYLEENGQDEEEEEAPRKRNHRYRIKKPSTYSRTTHNLLEKNRRAQLRDCLEVLRQHVPLPDKLTTLALLQSAKKYIENLQQKEKEENDEKLKLQHTQAVLLSRLAELGASNALQSIPTSSSLPPKDMFLAQALCQPLDTSPDTPPSIMAKGTQTEPCSSLRGSPKVGGQSPPPQGKSQEEDENVVIDILTHESEESDESSSTSGSDGGCTTTSHKYQIAV